MAATASDAVYLSNVSMMNVVWPDAALLYNSMGRLAGSEYIYTDLYDNPVVFNRVYRDLVARYGSPYAVNRGVYGGSDISWWGPGGQYIRLSYSGGTASDGRFRYYTTLNFGVY